MSAKPSQRNRSDTIRILIVDDHALFSQALEAALGSHGMDVVGVASNGEQAVEIANREGPDVALVDLRLSDEDGISVAIELMAEVPTCRVIALTALDDPRSQKEVGRAGMHGYVLKSVSLDQLVNSIESVRDGLMVFHPFASTGASPVTRVGNERSGLIDGLLTTRERQVLALLAEALDSRQIAERLELSLSTVRTHIQAILEKLSVHSRLEAVAFANGNGVIDLTDGHGHRARMASEPDLVA